MSLVTDTLIDNRSVAASRAAHFAEARAKVAMLKQSGM
jgi:hypothetical protein